jgi:hypothetical protein
LAGGLFREGGSNSWAHAMRDVEKRLLAVEQENRDLKAQLSALRLLLPPAKPAPPRRNEPQVRITRPPLANVPLPTEDEFRRLLEIVLTRYPELRPSDTQGFEAEFRAAFQFLAHTGRREKLDRDHGLLFWIDTARTWLRDHKIASGVLGIGGTAFVAAVIASGDILYTSPYEFPHISFGLVPYGGGIEAKDWWKRALAGTLLEPMPALNPTAVASPARVQR